MNNFGTHPAALVNVVEDYVLQLRSQHSKTKLSKDYILVSGMVDRKTGKMSKLYTNFKIVERKQGGAYHRFISGTTLPNESVMHPNMKLRFEQTMAIRNNGLGYNLDNIMDMVKTGGLPAAHAEVRALSDLAFERFGNNLVSAKDFDNWLKNDVVGYNSYLIKDGSQPPCADCFYLTDLVTFIQRK